MCSKRTSPGTPARCRVARHLSSRLDAPLFWPDVSRLVIDCNRAPDAASLIVVESEGRAVPANRGLSEEERARRLERYTRPTMKRSMHASTGAIRRGSRRALVAIHSYTPVYLGKARPWQVGIVFGDDRRLADLLIRTN